MSVLDEFQQSSNHTRMDLYHWYQEREANSEEDLKCGIDKASSQGDSWEWEWPHLLQLMMVR